MGALVFVTMELSPFTPGGIGRVIHNMLKTMSEADRARSIVLLLDAAPARASFGAAFPDVRLVTVDTTLDADRYESRGHHPPRRAYANTPWHWKSAVVYRALRSLAREVAIDYVEFPDWAGLGFVTLQEKRLRGFLRGATLAVRLHSSHTTLANSEAYWIDLHDLNLCDLERKCLRDCDMIVAQLAPVAEAMRGFFGFSPEEWAPRLVVHAPPVLLDTRAPASRSGPATREQAILFVSKLQRVKRPDLFARGVGAFFRKLSDFRGDAIFCAHSFDETFRLQIEGLIASDLKPRFRFQPRMPQVEREMLIGQSIVVVPSTFESFCLAAYEASLLGARVVLNGANTGFGEGTPWKDGVNCFKFDGTPTGLAEALERCVTRDAPLAVVEGPDDPWPWSAQARPTQPWRPVVREPLVSVVIPHRDLGSYVSKTLESVLEQSYRNLEVIVVDDASSDEASVAVIDELAKTSDPRLTIVKLASNLGPAGARNVGLRHAKGRYVVTLDADDLLHPAFVWTGVEALENEPDFDVMVTPAGFFDEESDVPLPGEERDFRDHGMFVGEPVLAGLIENRFATSTALFRRTVFDRFRYDEALEYHEEWGLYLRLLEAGTRFIVATDVLFHFRQRRDSPANVQRAAWQRRLEYCDLMRTSAPGALKAHSWHLTLGLPLGWVEQQFRDTVASYQHEVTALQRTKQELSSVLVEHQTRLETLSKSEVVFASLKLAGLVQKRLPFIVSAGRTAGRVGWRMYKAVARR